MTPKQMAKLLSDKLSKEEFDQFADILDSDPPAGPFWEAVMEINVKLNPQHYSNTEVLKEEV